MARTIPPKTTQEKISIDWTGAPVLISPQTSEIILRRSKHPAITLALYWFYYRCGLKQKTLQPWAAIPYVMKGLGIGQPYAKSARKELLEFGLIEIIQKRLDEGRGFGRVYTKVNYCSLELLPAIGIANNTDTPKFLGTKECKCLEEDTYTRNKTPKSVKTFIPPTIEEVQQYCNDQDFTAVDAAAFCDHFISNGWLVGGRSKMKDWRAAVRTWNRNDFKRGSNNKPVTTKKTGNNNLVRLIDLIAMRGVSDHELNHKDDLMPEVMGHCDHLHNGEDQTIRDGKNYPTWLRQQHVDPDICKDGYYDVIPPDGKWWKTFKRLPV